MQVLASGMGWISEQPGGLNRYFADYLSAWNGNGSMRGLVHVKDMAEGQEPIHVRGVRLSARNPFGIRREWEQVLRSELNQRHYDVYNPHFAYYSWAWPKLKMDIPVVTHFHGPWAYESMYAGADNRLRSKLQFWYKKSIEKSIYQRSDQFIVLSDFFKKELATHYDIPSERIHVIPGAVNAEKFHPTKDREKLRTQLGLPTDRLILLSVRRLSRRMGLDNLIRAIAYLRADFPKIYLVLVGGGELYRELLDLVASLGLEQHVLLTNRISDDLLPLYYQAADMTVVPSKALEGFGLTTVESMACGTPVMGTPLGGTTEILKGFDPGLLFRGTNAPDLVEGLGWALSHSNMLPSREHTRDYVLKNYTWDTVIPQIKEVFAIAGAGSSTHTSVGMEGRLYG